MKRIITVFSIMLLIFAVHSTVCAAPILSINAPEETVGVGNTATINIMLTNIGETNLDNFSFRIAFDSDSLGRNLAIEGDIIPEIKDTNGDNQVHFTSFYDQNDNLSIWYSPSVFQPLIQGELPKIENDGILATFDITATAPGNYDLEFLDVGFGHGGKYANIGKIQNGSITVDAVPLPSAVLLFGTGLIGLVGVRRKIKK